MRLSRLRDSRKKSDGSPSVLLLFVFVVRRGWTCSAKGQCELHKFRFLEGGTHQRGSRKRPTHFATGMSTLFGAFGGDTFWSPLGICLDIRSASAQMEGNAFGWFLFDEPTKQEWV